MSNQEELEAVAVAACVAELRSRGMEQVGDGIVERDAGPGITGSVGLPPSILPTAEGGCAVLITPVIGVRHEETSRLVSALRGLAPDDPARRSMGIVSQRLEKLAQKQDHMPPEWVMADAVDAPYTANKIADDIIFYGFPYMERLASPEAILEEMKQFPHKIVRNYDLAVMCMLLGQAEEAKKVAQTIGLPLSQNPTVWGEGYEGVVTFLDAFAAYFDIDLEISKWPVRKSKPRGIGITIRDRGVVHNALLSVGRRDLADKAAGLTAEQVKQISERSARLLNSGKERDPARAIGLAATELIEIG